MLGSTTTRMMLGSTTTEMVSIARYCCHLKTDVRLQQLAWLPSSFTTAARPALCSSSSLGGNMASYAKCSSQHGGGLIAAVQLSSSLYSNNWNTSMNSYSSSNVSCSNVSCSNVSCSNVSCSNSSNSSSNSNSSNTNSSNNNSSNNNSSNNSSNSSNNNNSSNNSSYTRSRVRSSSSSSSSSSNNGRYIYSSTMSINSNNVRNSNKACILRHHNDDNGVAFDISSGISHAMLAVQQQARRFSNTQFRNMPLSVRTLATNTNQRRLAGRLDGPAVSRRMQSEAAGRNAEDAGAAAGSVDCVVVGAGVVGLACARELALAGLEVLILEEQSRFGQGTSSRSSEVIHAGIYYPPNSLKARFCVEGKHLLYEYCAAKDVPHKRLGKLIVATKSSQNGKLSELQLSGERNGVHDLSLMSAAEACVWEPALQCTAALWSPSTGVLDTHRLMEAMMGDVEGAGGMLAVNTSVVGVDATRKPFKVQVQDRTSGEVTVMETRFVVNAAGLGAQQVALKTFGLDSTYVPAQFFAKGNYFNLSGPSPFSRLIYPLPEPGGIGVHLTLDMAGQARFGPDVEWVQTLDYQVEPSRGDAFYSRVREYFPALSDGSLLPAYSGIRPKIVGPGGGAADFMVQGPTSHGISRLVNLFGIESPGITSSLAIARHVAGLLLTT